MRHAASSASCCSRCRPIGPPRRMPSPGPAGWGAPSTNFPSPRWTLVTSRRVTRCGSAIPTRSCTMPATRWPQRQHHRYRAAASASAGAQPDGRTSARLLTSTSPRRCGTVGHRPPAARRLEPASRARLKPACGAGAGLLARARHRAALFRAASAGRGAFLAVAHRVLGAFVRAGVAGVRAHCADGGCEFTAARHRGGRQPADVGAFHVQRDASRHHLDIRFLKARAGAVRASNSARVARLYAGCVLLVSHCDPFRFLKHRTPGNTTGNRHARLEALRGWPARSVTAVRPNPPGQRPPTPAPSDGRSRAEPVANQIQGRNSLPDGAGSVVGSVRSHARHRKSRPRELWIAVAAIAACPIPTLI